MPSEKLPNQLFALERVTERNPLMVTIEITVLDAIACINRIWHKAV